MAIEVQGLTKRYGDTVALDRVELTVEEGEIFGLLGRNGAGKTTLVESIAGLRRPDSGSASVIGLDPWRDRARLRTVLGVQLQRADLHGALTVRELLRLYRSFYTTGHDPEILLQQLGLQDRRDTAFDDLSGGQRQRVSVALALIGRPRMVILDELTTGLDPEARRGIWSLVEGIRAQGVTVLLVSHNMDEVERLCDRIAIIDRGRIVALDGPDALVAATPLPARMSFRTDAPFDPEVLTALDEVIDVHVAEGRVEVTGTGELLQQVTRALITAGIDTTDTRATTPDLADAFLALTGSDLRTDLDEQEPR